MAISLWRENYPSGRPGLVLSDLENAGGFKALASDDK